MPISLETEIFKTCIKCQCPADWKLCPVVFTRQVVSIDKSAKQSNEFSDALNLYVNDESKVKSVNT